MKYCLKWNNKCLHLKDADEISIKYIEDRGLVDFMEKYKDKRIILRIDSQEFSELELTKLVAIKKQYPNYQFTIALNNFNTSLIETIKEKELPFYIDKPIQNWETFTYLIKTLGVSDIDLSGALAFELSKVKQYLEKNDAKTNIRLTPNIISAQTKDCPPLQHFFIRPEDIDLYEPYVDVIEFEGLENQDTFYNIYAKEKMFIGKLNQVIYNFPLPIDNVALITAFGERRLNCGRECLQGGHCRRCNNLASISEKLGPVIREKVKENLQKQLKDKSSEN